MRRHLLLFCLGLSGCATPRMMKLADGTKVPASPTYVSANEMRAKGQNAYGVPETSFAFYEPGYKPSKSSVSGLDEATWTKLSGGIGPRFRPTNTPDWEWSSGDPPSVRHDCFTLEKLFLVPWGNGDGAQGIKMGERMPIALGFFSTGEIGLWTEASNQMYFLDMSGKVKRVIAQSFDEFFKTAESLKYKYEVPENWKTNSQEEYVEKFGFLETPFTVPISGDRAIAYKRTAGTGAWTLILADMATKKVLCKVYAPLEIPFEGDWQKLREKNSFFLCITPGGTVFYPVVTEAGLEIYVYR